MVVETALLPHAHICTGLYKRNGSSFNGEAILLCAIYHLEIRSSILIADGISFTLWHSSPLYINVVSNATGILGIRSCLDVSLRFIIVSRGSYTSFAIRLNGDVAKATVASLNIFYSTSARRGRCDRSLCSHALNAPWRAVP